MRSVSKKRSRSGLLLAASNFGVFAFPLIRGIALAHLLSKQDFGLAISITTMASVIDLISEVGLNQFAVKVEDPGALPTLQSIALIRGALLGIGIALCGPLFALLFNAPGTGWVYILVGLASAIRGFANLGVKRAMRSYNFVPEAITDTTANIIWTAVSIGMAFVLRDYRSMVLGLLAFNVAYAAVTHLLSPSSWRLGWDRAVVRQALRFGRPLAPNGAALAVMMMGDRTLIGSVLGLDALASYSALSTSAFTPRAALLRFLNSLLTPQFVNARTQPKGDALLVTWTVIVCSICGAFAYGYMAFGQPLITLVFGRHYIVAQTLVSLTGVLTSIRFLANLVTPPSLAKGDTGLVLLNTVTSVSGLALGVGLTLLSPSIQTLVFGMCIGELIALFYVQHKLLASHPAVSRTVLTTVAPTLLLVIGCGLAIYVSDATDLKLRATICACFAAAQAVLVAADVASRKCSIRDVAGVFLPEHV